MCRSNNEEIITPQHLLDAVGEIRGTPLSTPTADITSEEIFRHRKQLTKHYQDIRHRKNTFWNALQTQYLETLRLIYEKDVSRLSWKKAIIKALIVSQDDQVRSCGIQTENGENIRPVNLLYKIELEIEDYYDAHLGFQQANRAQRHT